MSNRSDLRRIYPTHSIIMNETWLSRWPRDARGDRVQTDKENWMWVKPHKSRFVNAEFKFKFVFNNFNILQSISPTKIQHNIQMLPCNPAISQRIVRTEHHNAAKKHQYMRNPTYIHCAKREKYPKTKNYNLSRVRIHAEWRRVSFTAPKTFFSVK